MRVRRKMRKRCGGHQPLPTRWLKGAATHFSMECNIVAMRRETIGTTTLRLAASGHQFAQRWPEVWANIATTFPCRSLISLFRHFVGVGLAIVAFYMYKKIKKKKRYPVVKRVRFLKGSQRRRGAATGQ